MKVRVEVTAEDIAAGEKNNCYTCPVALALNRATGRQKAWVGFIGHGDESPLRMWHVNSREIRDFVEAFDRGETVAPFSFETEVPE